MAIDPGRIKRQFDDPIDRAATDFDCEPICPISHKAFHRVIARFVEEIYGMALGAAWRLADPLAEAIGLLEASYRSPTWGAGYVAALLDANDPAEGGIRTVLTGLADSIKEIERRKYTTGVFLRRLAGCSWQLRCEMVRVLLEDYRPFIPERLGQCAPAQLADEIPSLLAMLLSSDSVLQQIVSSSDTPRAAETEVVWEPL